MNVYVLLDCETHRAMYYIAAKDYGNALLISASINGDFLLQRYDDVLEAYSIYDVRIYARMLVSGGARVRLECQFTRRGPKYYLYGTTTFARVAATKISGVRKTYIANNIIKVEYV